MKWFRFIVGLLTVGLLLSIAPTIHATSGPPVRTDRRCQHGVEDGQCVSARLCFIIRSSGVNPSAITCQDTPYANSSPFDDSPLWAFNVYGNGTPLLGGAWIEYRKAYGRVVDSGGNVFTYTYP